ncbi:MAG: hypothetical protein LBF72_01345 [Holosporales bacterium]|nr:hypothetical protein [Holosporales bacterium]
MGTKQPWAVASKRGGAACLMGREHSNRIGFLAKVADFAGVRLDELTVQS